jgi:hypothetical protein
LEDIPMLVSYKQILIKNIKETQLKIQHKNKNKITLKIFNNLSMFINEASEI